MHTKALYKITICSGLARNALWNMIGLAAPMVVAILTIPCLLRGLGAERFGVLTLAWALIGYFSLFDFGLGRALTLVISEKLGRGQQQEIPSLFWTSMALMILLGLVGTVVGVSLTPWFVRHILRIQVSLQDETTASFLVLSASIPVTIANTGLRGALEAYQRFDLTSCMRVAMGTFTFIGPILVLPFSHSLIAIVYVLLAGRVMALLIHFILCINVVSSLREARDLRSSLIWPLIKTGGWMTVSNIISPLMVSIDRVLIASMVSVSAVAYYSTPFDVVTTLLVIPSALAGVLLPRFSFLYVTDRINSARLFKQSIIAVLAILIPIVLVILVFARYGLQYWLGLEFAREGAVVAQWIAIGVLTNGLGVIAFALVQGVGRSDITALFHLLELPIYLPTLWFLVRLNGIQGAAMVWTLRVTMDMILLFAVATRLLSSGPKHLSVLTPGLLQSSP